MFNKTEKRKKHHGMAIAIGALAMFGAYRMIAGVKNFCVSKTSAMMNSIGKMKKKKSCESTDCEPCSDCCDNADEEPYD